MYIYDAFRNRKTHHDLNRLRQMQNDTTNAVLESYEFDVLAARQPSSLTYTLAVCIVKSS